MNLKKLILTNNDCYKAGRKITPKGVMIHSTGVNNPKVSRYVQPNIDGIGINPYNNDWNRPNVKKCVHSFIGKLSDGSVATVQTLPWNWRGWHCGGAGNNTHISFEICEDGLTDASYFKAVYQEAVELTAMLCKEYKLDPMKDGVVICHKEGYKRGIASGHSDVLHWFPKHDKDMDDFRTDVKKAMGEVPAKKTSGSGATVTVTLPVLQSGSKGESVRALQILLNGMGYSCGNVDGSYGPKTVAAVTKFQKKVFPNNKKEWDGSCGKNTWTALLTK